MTWRYLLLAAFINIVCGTGFALRKYMLLHGWTVTGATIPLLGLPGILLLPWLPGALRRFDRHDLKLLTCMGLSGIAAPTFFSVIGCQYTTAIKASMLNCTEPVFIVLMGALWLRERLHRRKLIGMLVCSLGAILIAMPGQAWADVWSSGLSMGDFLILGAAMTWASYSILLKYLHNLSHPFYAQAYCSVVVTVCALPWAWSARGELAAQPLQAGGLAALFSLVIAVNIIGYSLWNLVLEKVEASLFGLFVNLQPLSGVALGMLLLGETLSFRQAIGGGLVLGGLYITTKPRPDFPGSPVMQPNADSAA